MALEANILFGKVMHKRLTPKINQFIYSIYYLALPLSKLSKMPLAYNRPGLLSFYDKDHGSCDGSDLEQWARKILESHKLNHNIDEIVLICMPRVLGYVFNPVSFWLCLDQNQNLKCVLCEVNNTFGEQHIYVCADLQYQDLSKMSLTADKIFHVSPFLERQGQYHFRFNYDDNVFSAHIDLHDKKEKKLLTSITGKFETLNKTSLIKAFCLYPLITMKAIFLIHWQALKLILKRIRYIRKPNQLAEKISSSHNLNNN